MEKKELKAAIEALIFAADQPISVEKLAGVLELDGAVACAVEPIVEAGVEATEGAEVVAKADEVVEVAASGAEGGGKKARARERIREATEELIKEYAERDGAITIERVAGGLQMRTRVEYSRWIKKLYKAGVRKLSRPAMETLAIVAYKQPVTRGDVEGIRGVDSGGVLGTLMEKRLIKITGRKEAPGRPPVYGTTREFLETFDLKTLSHLPGLKDIEIIKEEMEMKDAVNEAAEDTLAGGGGVEAQGRGDDPRGTGEGQPPDGDGAGNEG